MSYFEVDERENRRIPLPKFSYNAALTFKKDPNQNANYKKAKNLLFAAKYSNGKVPSRKKKKKENLPAVIPESSPKNKFSLSEKLVEVYLEMSKKKKIRDGCFMKSNILQELIMTEDLSYFIMKVFPTKLFLYYRNPYRVKYFYHANVDEESELFESIDREEIPNCIFDQIMSCENWFLMYDYHCFLQIQKYAHEDDCAQPILSEFVLLKPTTMLLLQLVNKSAHETNNNNESAHEEFKSKYESKILFDISGPLYLDTHPTAEELMNFLKNYQSPFGSCSLKDALAKRPVVNRQLETNPCQEELLKIFEETFQESSSEPMDFESSTPVFVYENWKKKLQSFLSDRSISIRKDDNQTIKLTTFVELYELTTDVLIQNKRSSSKTTTLLLSVFWRDDMFYTCLTFKKYVFDPEMPYDFLSLIGEREDLDRYIFKVAEGLSDRYTKNLSINYKNMLTNDITCFVFPVPELKDISDGGKNLYNDPKYYEYRDGSSKKKSSDTKYDEQESVAGCSSNQKKSLFILSDSDSDDEENSCDLVYKNLSSHSSSFKRSYKYMKEAMLEEEGIDPSFIYSLKYAFKPKPKPKQKYVITEDEDMDNLFQSFASANVHETEKSERDDSSTPGHASSSKEDSEMYVHLDLGEDDFDVENHLTNILNSSRLKGIFSKPKRGSKRKSNLPREHLSTAYANKLASKRLEKEAEVEKVLKGLKQREVSNNLDYYPKLKGKFEFTMEDFMKDIKHEHGKGLKWLVNELLPRNEDYS